MTSPEAAHGQDDAQVEGEDEGERQGEGDEEVHVGEDGQEVQVALFLLARGVHGAERPVGGEEAVQVEEEGQERDEADGRSGVTLGAQHGGAQRVADGDVPLHHQQDQVPRGQEAAGVRHVDHHLATRARVMVTLVLYTIT